eukprot:SAG31_NODE_1517_length_8031_cov_18.008699_3_plen_40_part_00
MGAFIEASGTAVSLNEDRDYTVFRCPALDTGKQYNRPFL